MGGAGELVFDPGALNAAQRAGDGCVVCGKRWPRPNVRVGCLPDGTAVYACPECAPVLPRPGPRPGEPADDHDVVAHRLTTG
jgi:hypothetical protein